jgi:hypothetical protein
MNKTGKQYDLEERTLEFAKRVRRFVKKMPKTIANLEDIRQVVRSSGSVGANYIEANDSLSKRDFSLRIKICIFFIVSSFGFRASNFFTPVDVARFIDKTDISNTYVLDGDCYE